MGRVSPPRARRAQVRVPHPIWLRLQRQADGRDRSLSLRLRAEGAKGLVDRTSAECVLVSFECSG